MRLAAPDPDLRRERQEAAEPWSEEQFEHELLTTLEGADRQVFPWRTLRTFDEAGVLTQNAGLVVRMDDGSEFQVTVVQSR